MPHGQFAEWRNKMYLDFLTEHKLSGSEYGTQAAWEHEFILKNYWTWRIHRVAANLSLTGVRRAGRLLDGREWNEAPEVTV